MSSIPTYFHHTRSPTEDTTASSSADSFEYEAEAHFSRPATRRSSEERGSRYVQTQAFVEGQTSFYNTYPTVSSFPLVESTSRRGSTLDTVASKTARVSAERHWLKRLFAQRPRKTIRQRTRTRRVFQILIILFSVYYILLKLKPSYVSIRGTAGRKPMPTVQRHRRDLVQPRPTLDVSSQEIQQLDDKIRIAAAEWQSKLDRQSKNATEAIVEYRRRYGLDAPTGYAEWFEYAQAQGVQLPDEYDSLMKTLKPFRQLTSYQLKRRTVEIGSSPSFSLLHVKPKAASIADQFRVIKQKTGINQDRSVSLGNLLKEILSENRPGIGDMSFAVNEIADPRILLSWETRDSGADADPENALNIDELAASETDFYQADEELVPTQDWGAGETTWIAYARSCSPVSKLRRVFYTVDDKTRHFLLAEDNSANFTARPFSEAKLWTNSAPAMRHTPKRNYLDSLTDINEVSLCNDPDDAKLHGLFYSDWRAMDGLYPVFSHSSIPGFSDILIPAVHHTDWPDVWDREPMPEWDERADRLYWRGSADGGGNRPSGRQLHYQRQRFVSMVNRNDTTFSGDEENAASLNRLAGQVLASGHLDKMDVAFDNTRGCGEAATCEALGVSSEYRLDKGKVVAEFAQVKMTVDLDGNAYSARFGALLQSGAAVVKSTIYREFYQDHMQPWFHFIPMSLNYNEFPALFTYFFGAAKPAQPQPSSARMALASPSVHPGRNADLRAIAEQGKAWQDAAMGEKAALVYVYRLALEWSRLQNRQL